MRIVPAVVTPISAEHARDALAAAMPGIDRESASLLLSLIWVETARGHMMNWNAGNITASAAWAGDAWRPPWFAPSEDPRLAALHERMLAGTAPSAFRAYNSATEGFADFAHVLQRQFASVLEAARSGNPAAFVQALHDSGYSRDYTLAHVPTFAQLRELFAPLVAHFPAGAVAGGVAGVALLVVAGLVVHHFRKKPRRRKHVHA